MKLVLAAFGVLLACCLVQVRAKAGEVDSIAKYYAGIGSEGQPSLEDGRGSSRWSAYSFELDRQWGKFTEEQLSAVRSFSRRHVRSPHRVAYYMFSGPDFPYVDAVFPDAAVYILSGLEPVKKPARLTELEQSGPTLKQLLASLNTYFSLGFFKTEEMRAKQVFAGLTPLLMALIARSGNTIQTVETFHLGEDGKPVYDNQTSDQPDGLKIVFANSRAQTKQLYYVGIDLSNESRKLEAFLRFCRDIGDGDSLLKSASYLLHREDFSKVREFLLAHSTILVEDDSGIPVRYLGFTDWTLSLFGRYQAPLGKFETYYQPELASMHQPAKFKSYTFGMGYLGQVGGSHLLVARRRSNS